MQNPADETQLSIPEAVLLGHALVQRVADSRGIRAFFIKGPASVVQGLRLPKMSVDVDVFVAPADLEALLGGLRERGWRERPVDPDERSFPHHSATIDNPSWPCCIDVHFRFPGMEGAPGDSFDVMWAHTEILELAGQEVRVPSKALGILILALHALRSPHLPACRQELEFLAEITGQEEHIAAVVYIATATGSLAAMRPFLEDLLPEPSPVDWPETSTVWRNRLVAKEPGSAQIIAILQAPLRHKPKLLLRGLFPAPQAHLARNIYADLSFRGRLRLHKARWVRFLRSVPKIVKDLSQLRRRGPAAKSAGPLHR
ncbi:nucleotidyltransferase family protein [Arthrobacter sp. UNC362MFTsu5.1]|uniref:nucleotidyltransferase family protein n=1 Tax=Arthrobacter sp. UNC362MFTsu5.1 TaxID=1449044 RepID=UPI00068F98B5|nr:nucleotidyltransferase family protein [Arthrobacter sp. UNC362MFTsu5.1]